MAETGQSQARVGALTTELEGTKQSLEKAKEENGLLAFCLQSLTDELERTKQELQKLKATDHRHQLSPAMTTIHPDVDEDLKFVENEKENSNKSDGEESSNNGIIILQKKRYVKFASPPELDRIISSKDDEAAVAEKSSSSVKRMKKKTLGPLIGWLFAKKKGNSNYRDA